MTDKLWEMGKYETRDPGLQRTLDDLHARGHVVGCDSIAPVLLASGDFPSPEFVVRITAPGGARWDATARSEDEAFVAAVAAMNAVN